MRESLKTCSKNILITKESQSKNVLSTSASATREETKFWSKLDLSSFRLKADIKKLNRIIMVPILHRKYVEDVQKAKKAKKASSESHSKIEPDLDVYEMPKITEEQALAMGIIKRGANFTIQNEVVRELKENSRNCQNLLQKYKSAQSSRNIKTSQSRLGMLTSRESILRPNTGLGLVSETTVPSDTGKRRNLSRASQNEG